MVVSSEIYDPSQGDASRKVTEAQLRQYPSSSLRDIYKSFFQDEYGPGHLLRNEKVAREYYDRELSEMKSKGYYENEACGLGNNFYRVCLDKVIDGKIHPDDFFNVFMQSSADFRLPEIEIWRFKWDGILRSIFPLKDQVMNFDADRKWISQVLGKGGYVVHHSRHYIRAYDPHYRIIKRELLF